MAVDSASSKAINIVKMWHMLGFETTQFYPPDKQPFLSVKTQVEYDCEQRRMRFLYSTLHSRNMGEGELVRSINFDKSTEWQIPTDGLGKALVETACRKR
jgi:hypothetical protein